MDGGIGANCERHPRTQGTKNDSRKRGRPGRKRGALRVPKRRQKARKNKTRAHRRCGGTFGRKKACKRAGPPLKTKALV